MTDTQKLIDKLNRLSLMIGVLHSLLIQQRNKYHDEDLIQWLELIEKGIDDEFYGAQE